MLFSPPSLPDCYAQFAQKFHRFGHHGETFTNVLLAIDRGVSLSHSLAVVAIESAFVFFPLRVGILRTQVWKLFNRIKEYSKPFSTVNR
jgi:hypothetical protein